MSKKMDATGLIRWARQVPDGDKPALADRIANVRAGTYARYLDEARASAESAAEGVVTVNYLAPLSASTGPADWHERDMAEWNRLVGDALRGAYHDALFAIVADGAIGKGHRRVLAAPLLPEIPELSASLEL
jgi:hypothetical protein